MDTQSIHTELYITHDNDEVMDTLTQWLEGTSLDEDKLTALANEFAIRDTEHVERLFAADNVASFEFEDGFDEIAGFRVFHLLQGEWGDSHMVRFIDFLYRLIPGIHAQAWGFTEDEPWEFFIKMENGRIIKQEHVPWEDDQMDQNALEYIYTWWHDDLPDEIEAGLLNVDEEFEEEEDDDDDDDDWDYGEPEDEGNNLH